MKTQEQKKQEALKRHENYQKLNIIERIKKLDKKLGVGVGAQKERKKLAFLLQKQQTNSVPPEPPKEITSNLPKNKKDIKHKKIKEE